MNPDALLRPRHRAAAIARAGIRLGTIASLAATLAACNVLPKPSTIARYAPQPAITADPAWPTVDWQLAIPRPYADAGLDSARIAVRPTPGELQVYKGAAWAQSAPDLVHNTLLRAFADSGRLPGVARRGEGVNAEYELLLELRSFEADYADAAVPSARIVLAARLVHNRDNRVVANRVFSQRVNADGTDVAAVAQAFERGLAQLAPDVVGWTLREGADRARSSR
jgi:cholesterol transport system auxiliary component